jgi:uncharacterized protein YciI
MLFVVTAIDKEGSLQLRLATREAHFAYVKATGALRLGGPFLDRNGDMAGSMMIIRPWKATANFCDARLG